MLPDRAKRVTRVGILKVRAVHAARLANEDPTRYRRGLNTLLDLAARMRRRIVSQFDIKHETYEGKPVFANSDASVNIASCPRGVEIINPRLQTAMRL